MTENVKKQVEQQEKVIDHVPNSLHFSWKWVLYQEFIDLHM